MSQAGLEDAEPIILLGRVAEKSIRSVPVPVITVGETDEWYRDNGEGHICLGKGRR